MANSDFFSTLDRLINPTQDLGGGPGDPAAIARLILSGGRASLEGQDLFNRGVPTNEIAQANQLGPGRLFGPRADDPVINLGTEGQQPTPVAQPARLRSPTLQGTLDTAKQIAESLAPGSTGANVTKTLLANPYGRGSYDPTNPEQVAAVQKEGEEVKKLDRAKDYLSIISKSGLDKTAQGEIVKRILQEAGITQDPSIEAFKKAFATTKGAAEGGGEKAGSLSELDLRALASGATPSPALKARNITTPEKAKEVLSGIAEEKRGEKALQEVGSFVNKTTGEFVNDPDITAEELQRNYKKLSKQQLQDKTGLDELINQANQYERLIKELGLADIPKGTDIIKTATQAARLKFGAIAGDQKVKDLQTVRGRISALAGAFGQDKRITEKEYNLLQQTTLSDFDSKQGAETAIKNLREFAKSRAISSGIPIAGVQKFDRAAAIAELKRRAGK